MVKFAKHLEVEAVPEWRAAYCSYKELKKCLNSIKDQTQLRSSMERHGGPGFYRSLESPQLKPRLSFALMRRRSHECQQTDFVRLHLRTLPDGNQVYETQLEVTAAPTAFETSFFAKLDEQLNKIKDFYRSQEAEQVKQAEVLEKQMEALLEMNNVLNRNKGKSVEGSTWRKDSNTGENDTASCQQLLPPSQLRFAPTLTTKPGLVLRPSSELGLENSTIQGSVGSVEESKASGVSPAILLTPQHLQDGPLHSLVDITVECIGELEKSCPKSTSDSTVVSKPVVTPTAVNNIPDAPELDDFPPLNQMIMAIPRTNPRAAISAISQMFRDDIGQQLKRGISDCKADIERKEDPAVNRKEVQYAAKMLRTAYVEFYRGLTLLKSYSSLNVVAFGKILKKYDKITGRRASPMYLEAVEASYFHTSDKIARLIDKVELIFTTHFTRDDRRIAMRSLRPLRKRASHRITFFLGLFSGCNIALIVALVVVLHIGSSSWEVRLELPSYFDSLFQVFSMLGLIVLHLYLYGWNVYLWRRARINYGFIFEFAPGKELRYREILLVASGLLALLLGGMLAHLGAHYAVDLGSWHHAMYVPVIPLAVVLVFLLLLFLPFNICYYSSRKFFLKCLVHIIMSPLYKVVLSDFFIGDQLTSQVQMLRNMEFFSCYYMGGYFKHRQASLCLENKHFQDFAYVIALLPYYLRLMQCPPLLALGLMDTYRQFGPFLLATYQCVRRWFDESNRAHIANGLKYLLAMLAVVMRMIYSKYSSTALLVMVIITSVGATGYGLYWDLVVDWGLLQRHSKNPWLRDKLMLESRAVYFISMVANSLLRLAWLLSLNHLQFTKNKGHFEDLLVAALEISRRAIWNFFRLENEHLNNVGNYRAVKTVPLPFRELVDEGAYD